jgi:hypothetical protein
MPWPTASDGGPEQHVDGARTAPPRERRRRKKRRRIDEASTHARCGMGDGRPRPDRPARSPTDRRTRTTATFVGLLAFYEADDEYLHRCTGALVSPTVVQTAAHCTHGTTTAFAYFSVEVPDDFRENPRGIEGTT